MSKVELPNIKKSHLSNLGASGMKIQGVTIYVDVNRYLKTAADALSEIKAENKSNPGYGYHYLLDNENIIETCPTTHSITPPTGKKTYINNNLFKGEADKNTISILLFIPEKQNYEKTERILLRFIAELLKNNKLKAVNVWRCFDLYEDLKNPLHMMLKTVFSKYITELEKYIPKEESSSTRAIDFDSIVIESPYKGLSNLSIDNYIKKIYSDYKNNPDKYSRGEVPWDKGLYQANVSTGAKEEGNKDLNSKNTLQYSISQNAPNSNCECVRGADHADCTNITQETNVEPIYPDIITPPGGTIHISDGSSEASVQSKSDTPLTVEEFEKRQKTFNIKDFEDTYKETIGRPINCEDEFPVDEQIKKLEQHYPKVKIDKIKYFVDDTNHPGSIIGKALMENNAMIYDIHSELSKRIEKRLVKIENNLATVMRNLFRISSRMNINCVYYGGQSIYSGKYRCIRCLDDKRINDGAIVTLDQCLSCTRYEPILGQVYAILDSAGSNITQVMDDMQMSYMDRDDMVSFSRTEEYNKEKTPATVSDKPKETPLSFVESKWKDTVKEAKKKIKDSDKMSEEEIRAVIDSDEYKQGFVMDWNPTVLETQKININKYNTENTGINKSIKDDEYQSIERDAFDNEKSDEAIEYEELTFDINGYTFNNFGANFAENNGMSSSISSSSQSLAVRNKIVEYAQKAVDLCKEGKGLYSQEKRYNHIEKNGPINDINYWDCSSLVETAYKYAGIVLNASTTYPQYDKCKDSAGGLLIPIANESEAKPGDMVFFNNGSKPTTKEGLNALSNSGIYHVGIYMGNGSYAHAANPKKAPTEQICISPTKNYDPNIICFGRIKDLITLDNQSSNSTSGMNNHWTREYHNITDEWWNAAKGPVASNVSSLKTNMVKYGYKDSIISISNELGVDPTLTAALIAVESSGNPIAGTGLYKGLMQVSGGKNSTNLNDIKNNIRTGLSMLNAKKGALKNKGWKEENVHVLVSAYNSGEGTVCNAHSRYGGDLATMKIPELGQKLHDYVKAKNPSWSASEKKYYTTKVLIAYNYIYEQNLLGLATQNNSNNNNSNDGYNEYTGVIIENKFGKGALPTKGTCTAGWPKYRSGSRHTGVDIANSTGTPIYAWKSGTVTDTYNGYGHSVYITHDDGISMSIYGHNSKVLVTKGQKVKMGEKIALMGSTGNSTGPHLHFEVRPKGGKYGSDVDPWYGLKYGAKV